MRRIIRALWGPPGFARFFAPVALVRSSEPARGVLPMAHRVISSVPQVAGAIAAALLLIACSA
ncbi:MAG TPA: hypothetical protein VHX16_10210, partial [Chloroflexota bacterium]|nr:hypothetical protein [Chloroflexota bacterium]